MIFFFKYQTYLSSCTSKCNFKKHQVGFQEFLDNNIDRSKMHLMIYGVSSNTKTCLGYVREPLIKAHDSNYLYSYYLN